MRVEYSSSVQFRHCDTMNRVMVETLGCKLNQAESESLLRQLCDEGFQIAESPQEADIYVLNTCTVTHIADRKARHRVRWVRRNNPGAKIVATGCYARRAGAELASLGVDLLVEHPEDLLARLQEIITHKRYHDVVPSPQHHIRTRTMVTIQQGCNNFCAFCIVPEVRGRERSTDPEQVIGEITQRVAEGYREVVLTGTKIGAYRYNGDGVEGLPCLIRRILAETGIERLHLSSLQPQELTPGLLELWDEKRLCNHLHIPLQSGSDKVLQEMRRKYTIASFQQAIAQAREVIPGVAITTDILVGFPGESEQDFEDTYSFCEKMGFAGIHVFPYSARSGTRAAGSANQVNDRVKKGRTQRMLSLAAQSAQRFREQFLGLTLPVLWEEPIGQGVWSGLTPNYLRVFAVSQEESLANRQVATRAICQHREGLWGELVKEGGS